MSTPKPPRRSSAMHNPQIDTRMMTHRRSPGARWDRCSGIRELSNRRDRSRWRRWRGLRGLTHGLIPTEPAKAATPHRGRAAKNSSARGARERRRLSNPLTGCAGWYRVVAELD
jgi:hypothetical protein